MGLGSPIAVAPEMATSVHLGDTSLVIGVEGIHSEDIQKSIQQVIRFAKAANVKTTLPVLHVLNLEALMKNIDPEKRGAYAQTLSVLFKLMENHDNSYFRFEGETYGLHSTQGADALTNAKEMRLLDIKALSSLPVEGKAGGSFYDLQNGNFINLAATLLLNSTVARLDLTNEQAFNSVKDKFEQILRYLTKNPTLKITLEDARAIQTLKSDYKERYRTRLTIQGVAALIDVYLASARMAFESINWSA